MWLTQESDVETVEVIPCYGKIHVIGGECWCGPKLEQYEILLVIHENQN